MSQKFISLEDAAEKLGVAKDRLNQLREAGELRAYRDGASWKFRTEEIDKLEEAGMPADESAEDSYEMATGSDLSLASIGDGPPTPEPGENPEPPKAEKPAEKKPSETDKPVAPDSGSLPPLELDEPLTTEEDASAAELDTKAKDEKPAEKSKADKDKSADDDDIGLGIEPLGEGDDAESILLTGDQELEGGMPRPQSTIIGKSDLSSEDDLELAGSSDVAPADEPVQSTTSSGSGSFDDVEELELDLDESSTDNPPAAKPTPKSNELAAEESGDLELDLAGSDIDETGSSGSDILGASDSQTDSPSLSGSGSVAGLSGIDSIDLSDDEDDDMVLGGSDDSGDLGSGDSGINLSPSDSGFALDEVPLDLGGSAIGSQLDLASLSAAGSGAEMSGLGGEDFQLTPSESGEDDEDSSQIVALDDVDDEEDEDVASFEPDDDEVDFDAGGFGTETAAIAPAGAVAVQDVAFPGWVIGLLGAGFFSMLLCGLMAMDLVQTMWAWDEPFSFNSTVIEGLLSVFGQ